MPPARNPSSTVSLQISDLVFVGHRIMGWDCLGCFHFNANLGFIVFILLVQEKTCTACLLLFFQNVRGRSQKNLKHLEHRHERNPEKHF